MQKTIFSVWAKFALALTYLFASCSHTMQQGEIPLKDFLKDPESFYFKISPNGKVISCLKDYNKRLAITLKDVNGGKEHALFKNPVGYISRYSWSGNDQIVLLKDKKGGDKYHLFLAAIKTGAEVDLTPYDGVKVEWIESPNAEENLFYFGMNLRMHDLVDIYELNTSTRKISLKIKNPGNVQFDQIKTDVKGVLRSYIKTDGESQELMYRKTDQDLFRSILQTNFRDRVEVLGFSHDNNSIYASSNVGRDRIAIVRLDAITGKELEVIFEHPEVDVRDINFSRSLGLPRYALAYTGRQQIKVLDKQNASWFMAIRSKFPNMDLRIVDYDLKEDKFLIRTYSDKSYGSSYLYDRTQNKLIKLENQDPGLDSTRMASMRPVEFKSRDGMTIHAYLTTPLGKAEHNLPLIELVHSGPYDRDRWTYNRDVQLLASRGYAVLQVNYRGSVGYGRKYWENSFMQWGLAVQNDIEDGAKWLISKNIVDKARIGIYGYGFGGYCALVAASRNNDIYACGVSYSGFSNVISYLQEIAPQYRAQQQMYFLTVGDPLKEIGKLKSISPIFNTQYVKMPLLIAQGDKYFRTSLNETHRYVNLLKKRGIYPELIIEPGEGFIFTKDQNKMDFYSKLELFFEKHLTKL